MASHAFFCCEPECNATAHVSGGRCDECFEMYITKLREAHNPSLYQHKCSGEMDYDNGCYVCDDRDDPRCPSYRPSPCGTCGCTAEFRDGERVCWCDSCQRTGCVYSLHLPKCCADCGLQRAETEPVLLCDWYCRPCWIKRFKTRRLSVTSPPTPPTCTVCGGVSAVSAETGLCYPCKQATRRCADCDTRPEGGYFPYFRGEDALCADCAEPDAPEDWRESTGRCTECDYFFELICSSDRRDVCHACR